MAIRTFIFPAPSITASNPSVGLNGDAAPISSTQIGAENDSGDLVSLTSTLVGSDRSLDVNVTQSTLPAGAATAAKQDEQTAELVAANVSLQSIDNNTASIDNNTAAIDASTTSLDSKTVVVDTGNVTVVASALPTGAATSANQTTQTGLLTTIDADIGAIATSTASVDTKTPALVSGRVPVDGSGVTQPVSVASLPLPTGAATETTLSALNAKVTAVDTGAVVVSSSALPTGASTEATLSALNAKVTAVDTGAVVISSSALPTGAATETTLASIDTKTPALNVGRVPVLADQNGAWSVKAEGKSRANAPVRNDYTSVNVTTGTYVTLVASMSQACTELEIFDSSGQTLVLATGAAASEVDQIFVFPGGNGRVPLLIGAGTRVSIKAVSATASVGEICINFYE